MALTQQHFRFGLNSGTEATHGWIADEDANPSDLGLDTTFLLRFAVFANAVKNNVDFTFQYRLNGGTWTNITTTSAVVKAVNGILTNGGNCTQRLTGQGAFQGTTGQTEDGSSGGNSMDISVTGGQGCAETECALQIVSTGVTANDLIEFRLQQEAADMDGGYAAGATPAYRVPTSVALTTVSSTSALTAFGLTLALAVSSVAGTSAVGTVDRSPFNDARQQILDGLDSAQGEAAGWDALKASIPLSAVVRTSDTVVTITLPALGSYDITANETITATIPANALTAASELVATPTVTIAANKTAALTGFAGTTGLGVLGRSVAMTGVFGVGWSGAVTAGGAVTAALTGEAATSAVDSVSAGGVVSAALSTVGARALFAESTPAGASSTTILASSVSVLASAGLTTPVTGFPSAAAAFSGSEGVGATGTTTAESGAFNGVRQAILDGFVSAQAEPTGWNALRSSIPVTAVVRTSDTVVTITLPAIGSYDTDATETITGTVPAAALAGASALIATPTFTIESTSADVVLSGSAGTAAAGTLAPVTELDFSLVAETEEVGTLTPEPEFALTGEAAAGDVGTLTASATTGAVALTSVSGTGAQTAPGITATRALSGTAGTGARGSLGSSRAPELTGRSATAGLGTLGTQIGQNVTQALAGVSAISSQGTLSALGFDVTCALADFGTTAGLGSVVAGPGAELSSTPFTFTVSAVGGLTTTSTIAMVGCAAVSALEPVSPDRTLALDGYTATSAIQTLNLSPVLPRLLASQVASGVTGALGSTRDRSIAGQSSTSNIGTLSASIAQNATAPLTGLGATSQLGTLGTLGADVTLPLTGVAASSINGTFQSVQVGQNVDAALFGAGLTTESGTLTAFGSDVSAALSGTNGLSDLGTFASNVGQTASVALASLVASLGQPNVGLLISKAFPALATQTLELGALSRTHSVAISGLQATTRLGTTFLESGAVIDLEFTALSIIDLEFTAGTMIDLEFEVEA